MVLTAGCLDANRLANGGQFSCETRDDCPDNWTCAAGLCRDQGAPQVLDIVLSQSRAGPARPLQATVRTSGTFASLVPVVMGDEGELAAFAPTGDADVFELDLAASALPLINGVEHRVHAKVTYAADDENGVVLDEPEARFVVDTSPPALQFGEVPVRTNAAGAFSFVVAGAADIDADASVEAVAVSSECAFALHALVDGNQLVFTVDDEGDLRGAGDRCAPRLHGVYDLQVYGAVDEAGNALVDDGQDHTTISGHVHVDALAPTGSVELDLGDVEGSVITPQLPSTTRVGLCANGVADDASDPDVVSRDEVSVELRIEGLGASTTCTRNDGGCQYFCSWDTTNVIGADPDQGFRLASLVMTDDVGNVGTQALPLQYDSKGPEATAVSVLIPKSGVNPNQQPTSLGLRSTLVLAMATNEDAQLVPGEVFDAEAPADDLVRTSYKLMCGEEEVVLQGIDLPTSPPLTRSTSIELQLPAGTSGMRTSCHLVAELFDEHGNLSSKQFDDFIVVDTLRPDAEATIHVTALKHGRVPWGFFSTAGGPSFRGHALLHDDQPAEAIGLYTPYPAPGDGERPLFGAVDDAEEAVAFVRVFDSADGDSEIGRVVRNDDGLWRQTPFVTNDATALYLSSVDDAGNESTRLKVRDVTWVASMFGKRTGSLTENPHRFFAQPQFQHTSSLQGATETRLLEEIFDEETLTAIGNAGWENLAPDVQQTILATFGFRGEGSWARLGQDDTQAPLGWRGAAMTYDGDRNRTLVWGGSISDVGQRHPQEWTGHRFETRCEGNPLDDTCGAVLTARQSAELLWHKRDGGVWMVGGCTSLRPGQAGSPCGTLPGTVTAFDGDEVEEMCAPGGCGQAQRIRHRLAYDEKRGHVYLFGGCADVICNQLADDALYRWENQGFERVDVSGTLPGARAGALFTYDPTSDRLVLVGGCDTHVAGICTNTLDDGWTLALDELELHDNAVPEDSVAAPAWQSHNVPGLPSFTDDMRSMFVPLSPFEPTSGFHVVVSREGLYSAQFTDEGLGIYALGPETDDAGDSSPFALGTLNRLTPGYGVAFDGGKNRIWLLDENSGFWELTFSGDDENQTHDWVLHRGNDTAAEVHPAPNALATLTIDPERGRVLLAGRGTDTDVSTLAFNGRRWSVVVAENGATNPAGTRFTSKGTTILDNEGNWVPVFMSYNNGNEQSRFFDGTEWDTPNSIFGPDVAYNARGTFVGGEDVGLYVDLSGNTFRLELQRSGANLNQRWTALPSPLTPAREGAASAYHPGLGLPLVFGGCETNGGGALVDCTDEVLDDHLTYDIDSDTWVALPSPLALDTPPPRAYGAMGYDEGRGHMVLFGGCVGEGNCSDVFYDDTWEWVSDGNNAFWDRQSPADPEGDGNPSARARAMAVTTPGGMMLVGGDDGDLRNDVWMWNGGADAMPAHMLEVDFSAAGAPDNAVIERVAPRWLGGGLGFDDDDGASVNGALLLVWERGRWVWLSGTNAGIEEAEAFVEFPPANFPNNAETQARFARWPFGAGRKLLFAFVPDRSGPTPTRSRLTTFYADVSVDYVLPPD